MKFGKTRLAGAIAAACFTTIPVHAQSTVTLYGLIDINVEAYSNSPSGTVSGMRSSGQSGSRWGLRGTEDLGNGLKAVFQLESGFGVRNGQGDGRMFQRTAMVGLEGAWGELGFGRQYTSSFMHVGAFSPMGLSPQYDTSSRFVPVRADNAIRYRGKFGGLDALAYYAFRDQTEQTQLDENVTGSFGVSAAYNIGTVRLLGAYDRIEQPGGSTTTGDTDNYLVGARVDIGKFNVRGLYRYRTVEQIVADDIKSNVYTLAASYRFTPAFAMDAGYVRETFRHAPAGYLGTTDDTWQQLTLRGTYNLSKRTNLYAVLVHAIDGPINLGSSGDTGGTSYSLGAGETKQTGGAIGIRHLF